MFNVNDEINELIDYYNESVEIEYVMESYDAIHEELQNKVNSGELTLEDAEILNDLAYDKYVNEASRLAKEYNKKQSDYQKQKAETNKVIDEEDRKRGKYQQLAKKSLSMQMFHSNSPYTKDRLSRMNEESFKRENEAKKKLQQKKYVSKTRGLNRDIAVGDQPNSLAIGREYAKKIAQGKAFKYDKELLDYAKDSKKKQNEVKVAKGSKMQNVSYTPIKQREPGSVLDLADSFKKADIANKETKRKTGKHSFSKIAISNKKEAELREQFKKERARKEKELIKDYEDSYGKVRPQDKETINRKLDEWGEKWWNGDDSSADSKLYM